MQNLCKKIPQNDFAFQEYSTMFSIFYYNQAFIIILGAIYLVITYFYRFCSASNGANLLFIYNLPSIYEGYCCSSFQLILVIMLSKIYILKIYLNAIYMIVILYFVVSDKCNTFNYYFIIFIPSIFEVCA